MHLSLSRSLLVLACAALPFSAHAVDIQRWHTAEGTQVLLVARHDNPIVDVQISFKGAGAAFNPPGKGEVADFTAAILTDGTRTLDEEAFNARANDLAADIGSSSSDEGASIRLRSLSRAEVFNQFVSSSGYFCEGAGTAFMPYLLSTLDTLAWRYNVPEMTYPEALIPGRREVGARTTMNLWGNVYPRGGFLHQTDDFKAGAVVAQRAGDVVTRRGQIHVYQPLLANSRDGYWPAGALMEGDASTGKWQELTPVLSSSCTVFPRSGFLTQAQQGDYAWALWRPYACCERRGQVFLGSVDFL